MPRRVSIRMRGLLAPALAGTLIAGLLTGCVAGSSAPDLSPDADDARSTITVDGVERTYVVRVPETAPDGGDGAGEVPVIIAIHGVGSDAAEFEDYTGLSDAVDADRVMVVYPDGLPVPDGRRVWNAGHCCNPQGKNPTDDVAFLAALISELSAHGADPRRVYLAGFSNGGMFAYRAACELGGTIAGIAVVAGALTVRAGSAGNGSVGKGPLDDCSSTTPVPLVVVHGTDDAIVPFDGGPLSAPVQAGLEPVRFLSVAESVRLWRDRNGCRSDARLAVTGDVNVARYTDCAPGGEITAYTITGGGHSWQTDDGAFDSSAAIVEAFGL
jgi:polyhydroxybutyrate depolymerase